MNEERVVSAVIKHLQTQGSIQNILDIGCNNPTGRDHLVRLACEFPSVSFYGINPNIPSQQPLSNLAILKKDFFNYDSPMKFDVILLFGVYSLVIQTNSPLSGDLLLRKVNSLLKDKGVLIIMGMEESIGVYPFLKWFGKHKRIKQLVVQLDKLLKIKPYRFTRQDRELYLELRNLLAVPSVTLLRHYGFKAGKITENSYHVVDNTLPDVLFNVCTFLCRKTKKPKQKTLRHYNLNFQYIPRLCQDLKERL